MHGRLKVKTTAEQQEEKRKEREKKLAIYKDGMAIAIAKREHNEYDIEGLAITQQLLLANPDLTTQWNFRREILLKLAKEKETDANSLFKEELPFTESCLRSNPKSYGAWHHRCWVLDTMPKPDWKEELKVCKRYLEMDERNFHCWDYRRFIAQRSKVSAEEELEFTKELINKNFSNYSAWHYRSKLLPLVYPDEKSQLSINEEARLQELDLVQNAAFTDPNDQSAWFYHRWLLGRGEEQFKPLCLYVSRSHSIVIVALNKPVLPNSNSFILMVTFDENNIDQNWKPSNVNEPATVWFLDLPPNLFQVGMGHKIDVKTAAVESNEKYQLTIVLEESQDEGWMYSVPDYSKCFQMELSAAATSLLEKELESCEQLQELEPDNKWTLLTTVLLMRAIDSDKYENKTLTRLQKLCMLDINRKNYYKDLYSKFVIENILRHLDLNQRKVNLVDKNLTALYNLDHLMLVTELDLRNNSISSLKGLHSMHCLRVLYADNNLIESCSGLECLPFLEQVSLAHNKIGNMQDVQSLVACSYLFVLRLTANPITEKNTDQLKAWLEKNLQGMKNLYL